MDHYNVAFRHTRKTGCYHGVVIWTSFASKEKFDEWYTDEIKEKQKVVEEGITQKRAIELTQDTPLACRIAAALQDAKNSEGEVNTYILKMKMETIFFAEQNAAKAEGLL